MKLRVGLVGLGNASASRHRAALRALGDRFEVRAVCEPVAHRAERAAAEWRATAVDGYRALIAREDVDAVLLLSADWYGPLPILAACDRGKAVYCAATLDLDPDQARQVRERVDRAGIAFVAELACRQAPATLRLKELIATHLGPPRLLFCHQRQAAAGENGQPRPSSVRSLIETVDWCRYVVGAEPQSVRGIAHGSGTAEASYDYQMLSLDFSPHDAPGTGVVAQISHGRYLPAALTEALSFRPPPALQVACERGVAFVDLPSTLIWFDNAGRHLESLESERPVDEQLLLDFYRAVTSLVRPTASLDDAYRAMRIVLASERSHREGTRISLDP